MRKRYGHNHVALITCRMTAADLAALQALMRAYELPRSETLRRAVRHAVAERGLVAAAE